LTQQIGYLNEEIMETKRKDPEKAEHEEKVDPES